MAIDFSKFSEAFPADQLQKQMAEAKENGFGDKLPEGDYQCKLEKLELGEAKTSGKLMLKSQFRIVAGDKAKQCIFANQVLCGTKNDGFMMLKAKEFLESLDSGLDITFSGWEQFDQLVGDVLDAVQEDGLQYMINVKNDGDYQRYKVVDIIE